MKMLFVMPVMKYSGAPKMMATVANWFAEAGEDVTVCTFLDPEITQKLHENIQKDCLNFKRSQSRIGRLTLDYLRLRKAIIHYVLDKKPDVLMTFGDIFSTTALKALKKAGITTVVSERVDPSGTDLISRYKRKAFKNASGFVFQTDGAKNCFDSAVRERSYVVPNPVTLGDAECVPFAERQKKIVSVGRFEFKQKRQDVLIRAFEKVHEKYPDYVLCFYGDGPDLAKAKEMVAQSPAKDFVCMPGAVSPVEDYIKDAELSVLSSDYEGIPNAVIEAMNMCVPVVSTDCSPGGARLLLGEDEFGYVVPCGDAEALAEKMIYALSHPEEAQEKSAKAKASLERFEPSKIAEMWRKAVEEIKNRG